MKRADLEDGKTPDLTRDNLEALRLLFPQVVSEDGSVDYEALRQLLTPADEQQLPPADERYAFTWNGKKRARLHALQPSLGTLRPQPKDSLEWDTTQNLVIEGDNLEALKLLQRAYAGKVKMIYIDPPYNTGEQFIYPDRWDDNLAEYLRYTGQRDENGNATSSDTEKPGRHHTRWLNMMYPRLMLAHRMLKEDGVIFISIDDNEVHNLRKICDEIFGEENFVANIMWKKKTGAGSGIRHVFNEHEYVITFSKNINLLPEWRILDQEHGNFVNPDNDPNGSWESCALTAPSKNNNPNQLYMIDIYYEKTNMDINEFDEQGRKAHYYFNYKNNTVVLRDILDTDPETYSHFDHEKNHAIFIRRWAYVKSSMIDLFKFNRVFFKEGNVPRMKKYQSEYIGKAIPSIFFNNFSTQKGTQEVRSLLGDNVFEYPKPVDLIKTFISFSTSSDDLILDFFAGSGTTGHAVMQQNAEDGGQRRYILVQLPEPTDPKSEAARAGYPSIAHITRERLRRAAAKIKADNPMYAGDLGFRAFALAASNFKVWNPAPGDIGKALDLFKDNLTDQATPAALLYELMLRRGVDLSTGVETREVAGLSLHCLGGGMLYACLDPARPLTMDNYEALGLFLLAWHEENETALRDRLGDPSLKLDPHVYFLDAAFNSDDRVKVNLAAILEQGGVAHVRSL